MNRENEIQQHNLEQEEVGEEHRSIIRSPGMVLLISPALVEYSLSNGSESLVIPKDTIIGEIAFAPFGASADAKKRTQVLALGLQGLSNIVTLFDQAKSQRLPLTVPEYLIGTTNEQMAKFARRVGFISEKAPDSDVYRVAGSLADIKNGISEINNQEMGGEFGQLLLQRARRENPQLWDSLSSPNSPQLVVEELVFSAHPNIEERLTPLQERSNRLRRKVRLLKATSATLSTGELGFGIEHLLHGEYVSGGIYTVFSLGMLGAQVFISRKSKQPRS